MLATDWSATKAWVVGPPIEVECRGCGRPFDYRQRNVNPCTMWASCPHCHCSDVKDRRPIGEAIACYHVSMGWESSYVEKYAGTLGSEVTAKGLCEILGEDVRPDIVLFDSEGKFRYKDSPQ